MNQTIMNVIIIANSDEVLTYNTAFGVATAMICKKNIDFILFRVSSMNCFLLQMVELK